MIANGWPAELVSVTASALPTMRRVKSVMGKTIGTGMETRIPSGGKLSCIQFVGVVAYPPKPVKLFGSTSIELKCKAWTKVPSRMKPCNGAAQPSPITCNQLTSMSVSGTVGNVAASASLAGS